MWILFLSRFKDIGNFLLRNHPLSDDNNTLSTVEVGLPSRAERIEIINVRGQYSDVSSYNYNSLYNIILGLIAYKWRTFCSFILGGMYPSIYQYIHLSIHQYIHLSIRPFINISIYPFIHLHTQICSVRDFQPLK